MPSGCRVRRKQRPLLPEAMVKLAPNAPSTIRDPYNGDCAVPYNLSKPGGASWVVAAFNNTQDHIFVVKSFEAAIEDCKDVLQS